MLRSRRLITSSALLWLICYSVPPLGFAKDSDNKDRERMYDAPFDKVWSACVVAANEKFTLEHSEKASGVLSFKTGVSAASYGFTVGVTVIQVNENKTKVVLNPQKKQLQVAWGAGGRIGKKFFDAVDQSLKEQ